MRRFVIFLLPFFFVSLANAVDSNELCPGVRLETGNTLTFSPAEIRLLCGDQESFAWQKIPPFQARYFARTFLQARGYLTPHFEIQKGTLIISPGPLTRLRGIEVIRAPEGFNMNRRRGLLNEPLTPDLLTSIEKWAKNASQELGYACAKVTVRASPETGIARLEIDSGPLHYFGDIENRGLVTQPGLVDRNLAFLPGQRFDPRLLQLSNQRLLAQELYVSSYFDTNCVSADGSNSFQLVRHLLSSTPRLMTFGVGVDSEMGPVVRTSFRHALLTSRGGQSQIQATASYREQKLEAQMNLYPSSNLQSRFQWIPRFLWKREREDRFESITTQIGISPAYGFESSNAEYSFSWGPALEQIRLIEGEGPSESRAVTLNWNGTAKSHLFEYYAAEPREGWLISTNVNSRLRGISTASTTHRIQIDLQFLWNYRDYDPPLVVFGSRTRLGTFVLEDASQGLTEVPVSQRFFLGGDGDLRGFARKTIPFDQDGFTSVLSQGFEARWVDLLPWGLQPLVLVDFGWGSDRALHLPLSLNAETYFSPGVGLRWSSPLGPVRTTLAHGEVLHPAQESTPPGRWQWFVSFGREF